MAVANIQTSHGMADGKPGMSLDDVRAVYSGFERKSVSDEIPSRMLAMLRSSMREYVEDDADYSVLETWLKKGAPKAGLDPADAKKTPARVIILNCLRCHARDGGEDIGKRSPFGPDDMTVDYEMMRPLLPADMKPGMVSMRIGPQYSMPRLILVSHIHMLSIPMFTLVVGLLFSMTRWPAKWLNWLTPLPMIALVFDFGGWWLARLGDVFVLFIVGAGGVFGVVFAVQIVAILVDLWRPSRRIMDF
ncbi:MAG: hypothetical protein IPK83_04180 [Planctomycetes bacterium]|nr:hypothetical protein [Planctomycetota bacterium]